MTFVVWCLEERSNYLQMIQICFVTGKTLNELEAEANGQIILINKWLTANKLHLNMEKTCYTVFSPTKTKSPSIILKLNGNKLEQVTVVIWV